MSKKLNEIELAACDVLAICASEREHDPNVNVFTSDVADSFYVDALACRAFDAADEADPHGSMARAYARAECLIRTGVIK